MNIGSDSLLNQQLEQWQARLTTISRNLMGLAERESTKIIKAKLQGSAGGYTGITKEQAELAVKTLDGLWTSYLVLARVIEEACGLANKTGIFHNKESEIRELLEGASVILPVQHIAMVDRDLLADGDKSERITPEAMLKIMQQSFAKVRDTLSYIADANAQVGPRLAAIKQEVTSLTNWAQTLDAKYEMPADVGQSLCHIEADPLACLMEVDELEATVTLQRRKLQAIAAEHQATCAAIDRVKNKIEELKDLVIKSKAVIVEVREKIADPQGLVTPMSEAGVSSLLAWVGTLEENINAGHFNSVKIGIAKLEQACDARLGIEGSNYGDNKVLLDERADLRGRFKALRVKAQALQAKGLILGATTEGLAKQTQEVLDVCPLDIASARQLVGAFESALSVLATLHGK